MKLDNVSISEFIGTGTRLNSVLRFTEVQVMKSKFVTVAGVLIRLHISRTTLYNWEKAGVIAKPKRNRAGYRIYDADDIKSLEDYAFKVHYPEDQPGLFDVR